jgi:hypothetical protein
MSNPTSVPAFAVSDLLTGAGRFAVICAEARYASIATPGGDRIERRFVPPADWEEFAALGLVPGPLPADHVVCRMLIDETIRRGTTVQYVSSQPLQFDAISAAVILDAHLRAMASHLTR